MAALVFASGRQLHGGEQGGRVLRARYRHLLVEEEKRHTADAQTCDVGIGLWGAICFSCKKSRERLIWWGECLPTNYSSR